MLGQFLTVSPSFTADEQKIELQQRREDKMFEENIENSQDDQGGSETQEGVAREEEEKVEEMEEEEDEEEQEEVEEEEEKEVGLLDWMQKQQERKATLASACARDPG